VNGFIIVSAISELNYVTASVSNIICHHCITREGILMASTPLVLVPSHRGEWHFGLQQNILTYTKLCFLCKENIYIFVCMQTWHHFTYLENRFLKPVIYFNFINLNLGHEYFTILYNIIHWSTQNISLFNELNIYLFLSFSL